MLIVKELAAANRIMHATIDGMNARLVAVTAKVQPEASPVEIPSQYEEIIRRSDDHFCATHMIMQSLSQNGNG
ncbi:hypothetical protein [Absidia glauca]|uniref:Uncharacterized protein n=1 Tax=Absidia glauca TaxID=4829 RepID=A0A168MU69_ABSGL|nr:hypothetical protein [Absidia glauca]